MTNTRRETASNRTAPANRVRQESGDSHCGESWLRRALRPTCVRVFLVLLAVGALRYFSRELGELLREVLR